MPIIRARNPHHALPSALDYLRTTGVERASRNGPVLVAPEVVTTIYSNPLERVVFWPERDANPFFHLYESLWMLAGREDVLPLEGYVKNMKNYSDDGVTIHGAYGNRWRNVWMDQLLVIAKRLKHDPNDRRCVLQMWDSNLDLDRNYKDVPCNLTATFQMDELGRLNLVVFCRSNDIIWGCYGANAVHFSFLLEYMAAFIDCSVGTLTQVSVNWHGYLNTLEQVKDLHVTEEDNPYDQGVVPLLMENDIKYLNEDIRLILEQVDQKFKLPSPFTPDNVWGHTIHEVLYAHHVFKKYDTPERFDVALERLYPLSMDIDWVVAAKEWILRRKISWEDATGSLT
jgi:thymidylate synthase